MSTPAPSPAFADFGELITSELAGIAAAIGVDLADQVATSARLY